MKEDFLHYIWKYQKLNTLELKTAKDEKLTIHHPGLYLETAGPDFFNAQLCIDNQKWAGNVEIHVKSSDWYLHHHERDTAYDNVILHVVWEHDVAVYGPNNREIPVVVLRNYVSSDLSQNFQGLMKQKSWINCENQIGQVDSFILSNWQERLFFERLERKAQFIYERQSTTQNDWDEILFQIMAKSFGLNSNGATFYRIAEAIPFSIVRKEAKEVENLEALFFGLGGLLEEDKEDNYYKNLQFRFYYLLQKYSIEKPTIEPIQFFKHRPDNFATIRLSQLANLYSQEVNLFSQICECFDPKVLYTILGKSTSGYWETHYQFDKESKSKIKKISLDFIELLIVNTIVPIQFAYANYQGKEITERLLFLLQSLKAEKNAIIEKFNSYGVPAKNAYASQALLQLKSAYCNKNKCLNCAIGVDLLETNTFVEVQ